MRDSHKKLLKELIDKGHVEIPRGRLMPRHYWALDKGYAYKQAYQDQPHNIPYPFRPIKYYLMPSDYLLSNKERLIK